MSAPLRKVLVANRGEIAVRIIRACVDEGIACVAAVSEADADSMAARLADERIVLRGRSAAETYLSVPQVIAAALVTGCDALHPGYGFLSERPQLAEACEAHGIAFIGPPAEAIRLGGDKVQARELATSLGIPVGSGSSGVDNQSEAASAAARAGYPVLLKAAAGGGGRGMVRVHSPEELAEKFDQASEEARAAFGDGRLFVERFVENGRHVEVQIIADHHGNVVHLSDRDCSYQRRYQKLIEEAPAVAIPSQVRAELADAALALARGLDYVGAGTVEFLVDQDRGTFSFLEVNTRIQVEHPVTEMVTGVDLVREQLRVAAGERLSIRQSDVEVRGHAIECRINAESARREFRPAPGRIEEWTVPQAAGIRVDTHCYPGYVIPPLYDSLLAKLIVHGPDRPSAVELLGRALRRFRVGGVDTTLEFHEAVVDHPDYRLNRTNTRWVEEHFLPRWTLDAPGAPERILNGVAS